MLGGGTLISSLRTFVLEEDGQDLVEYGLLAGFIALAVVASITALGGTIATTYQSFSDNINGWEP